MTDIDRAVEIATTAAHLQHYDGPQPDESRFRHCVICNKEGYETDSGFVDNPRLEHDPEGDYWDGDAMIEADDGPHGWVCSNRCRSQSMYNHATGPEKEALDAVADACRVIREYGHIAQNIVGVEVETGEDFLAAVHDDIDDLPAWLNRPSREESMEQAITTAYKATSAAMCHAASPVQCRMRDTEYADMPDWIHTWLARGLGSWARIILELKESLDR